MVGEQPQVRLAREAGEARHLDAAVVEQREHRLVADRPAGLGIGRVQQRLEGDPVAAGIEHPHRQLDAHAADDVAAVTIEAHHVPRQVVDADDQGRGRREPGAICVVERELELLAVAGVVVVGEIELDLERLGEAQRQVAGGVAELGKPQGAAGGDRAAAGSERQRISPTCSASAGASGQRAPLPRKAASARPTAASVRPLSTTARCIGSAGSGRTAISPSPASWAGPAAARRRARRRAAAGPARRGRRGADGIRVAWCGAQHCPLLRFGSVLL